MIILDTFEESFDRPLMFTRLWELEREVRRLMETPDEPLDLFREPRQPDESFWEFMERTASVTEIKLLEFLVGYPAQLVNAGVTGGIVEVDDYGRTLRTAHAGYVTNNYGERLRRLFAEYGNDFPNGAFDSHEYGNIYRGMIPPNRYFNGFFSHVATNFMLFDICDETVPFAPLVAVKLSPFYEGLGVDWAIYKHVDGEFLRVLDMGQMLRSFIPPGGWPQFKPTFYLCADGRLLIRTGDMEIRHVEFYGNVMNSIDRLTEMPEVVRCLRMPGMEQTVEDFMAARVADRDEREARLPALLHEDEARRIVWDIIPAYNEISHIFGGGLANSRGPAEPCPDWIAEWAAEREDFEISHHLRTFALVEDNDFPHIRSVQDLRDLLNSVFTSH
jgi:hypothetical protein